MLGKSSCFSLFGAPTFTLSPIPYCIALGAASWMTVTSGKDSRMALAKTSLLSCELTWLIGVVEGFHPWQNLGGVLFQFWGGLLCEFMAFLCDCWIALLLFHPKFLGFPVFSPYMKQLPLIISIAIIIIIIIIIIITVIIVIIIVIRIIIIIITIIISLSLWWSSHAFPQCICSKDPVSPKAMPAHRWSKWVQG